MLCYVKWFYKINVRMINICRDIFVFINFVVYMGIIIGCFLLFVKSYIYVREKEYI